MERAPAGLRRGSGGAWEGGRLPTANAIYPPRGELRRNINGAGLNGTFVKRSSGLNGAADRCVSPPPPSPPLFLSLSLSQVCKCVCVCVYSLQLS